VNALELGTFRDSYVAEQESQDYSKPVRPPTYPTTEAVSIRFCLFQEAVVFLHTCLHTLFGYSVCVGYVIS